MGLALRYGVSESAILLSNDLTSPNLAVLGLNASIRIPRGVARVPLPEPSGAETERAKLRRFCVAARCGEAEGRYYLDDNGGDFDAAIAASARDDSFESGRSGADAGIAADVSAGGGGGAARGQRRRAEMSPTDAAAAESESTPLVDRDQHPRTQPGDAHLRRRA